MDRFYAPDSAGAARFELDRDETHHLAKVLRKAPGDVVEVFDGAGASAEAEVVDIGRRSCEVRIVGEWQREPSPSRAVVVASAMPKGDRGRFLVEKLTELGVERLVPLLTERTVVSPRDSKLDKLRQTVVAACKQCRRNTLMTIDPPLTWPELLGAAGSRLIVADRGGDANGIAKAVSQPWFAIGPEGGLTNDELEAARDAGARFASVGRHVLRIETAAIAAATLSSIDG